MKKSVLRSVKPYWIYCILEGLKNIEVGKDFPKAEDWDRMVSLYCSKDRKSLNRIPVEKRAKYARLMGKVVCKFECNDIVKAPCGAYANIGIDKSCLDVSELLDYADGKTIYGWNICDLVIYDQPKELSEFYSTAYMKKCSVCVPLCEAYTNCSRKKNRKPMTRPPQSWCYVERNDL